MAFSRIADRSFIHHDGRIAAGIVVDPSIIIVDNAAIDERGSTVGRDIAPIAAVVYNTLTDESSFIDANKTIGIGDGARRSIHQDAIAVDSGIGRVGHRSVVGQGAVVGDPVLRIPQGSPGVYVYCPVICIIFRVILTFVRYRDGIVF